MKIAMFSDQFAPELSGISDSIEALMRGLVGRGHAVDLYAPRYGTNEYDLVGLPRREIDLGPQTSVARRRSIPYRSGTCQSRLAVAALTTARRLQQGELPDVIHLHTFLSIGLEGLLAGRLLGIPTVITNHSATRAYSAYLPVPVGWAVSYVLWFCNRGHLVTAPSYSVFCDRDKHLLHRPLRIIGNPIDTGVFRPASVYLKADLRRQFCFHDIIICYAGRLAKEKNIDLLIEAVSIIKHTRPGIVLAIAGHGPEITELSRQAQHLGIIENIRFLGTLQKKELAKLFQASDIFATMSTSETQNLCMLQAMACGLPVVGADALALSELIDRNTGCLVEPGNYAALAMAIESLLPSLESHNIRYHAGPQFASQFSIPIMSEKWEKLYDTVIEERR